MKSRRATAGFTLVEVLVALLAMALLAGMAWLALDGVLRARDAGRESMDRTVRLATVLTQWEQDLRAVHDSGQVPAVNFDGQTLRLTRRVEGGVAVVAWAVRTGPGGGVWQRWASPPVVRSGALQEAWLRSQQLLGNEAGQLTLSEGASEWQIYFHRGGQWTNAQSSGDIATPVAAVPPPPSPPPPAAGTGAPPPANPAPAAPTAPPREQLPDAVRLVITLDGAKLTRDIALEPS